MRWFDPERFMAMIQKHRCTTMPAVPTMLALLLHHPKAGDYDLSSLSEVICGGAPSRPSWPRPSCSGSPAASARCTG